MKPWHLLKANKMTDDNRPFPIQASCRKHSRYGITKPSSIPWWLAEEAYAYYSEKFGNSQSLERLAERGGFGREELLMFIRRSLGKLEKL